MAYGWRIDVDGYGNDSIRAIASSIQSCPSGSYD
jgi:hypothetical protein